MIEDHRHLTGSEVANQVFYDFHHLLSLFAQVMPNSCERVLEEQAIRAKENKLRSLPIPTLDSLSPSSPGHRESQSYSYELPADLRLRHQPVSQAIPDQLNPAQQSDIQRNGDSSMKVLEYQAPEEYSLPEH